jgi:hypothetical protein
VERTNDILPEAVQRAFANAQGLVISLKAREARKVVAASVTAAAGVGAAPISAPDAAVLLPLQLGMLARISVVFGIGLSRDSMGKLINGLVGGGGPNSRRAAVGPDPPEVRARRRRNQRDRRWRHHGRAGRGLHPTVH